MAGEPFGSVGVTVSAWVRLPRPHARGETMHAQAWRGTASQGMGAISAERERFNQGSIPRHARSRLDLAGRGLAGRG